MTDELHIKAHNALASAVEMYSAILRGKAEQEKVLLANIAMLQKQLAEVKAQLASSNAVRESEAKGEVSRDGRAWRDIALDGGTLGQGEQGQEVTGVKEERSQQVGTEARSVELAKRASRQVPENFRHKGE